MYTLAILVTTFPPEVSGASLFNWERANWFANQGYQVIVFAPDSQHNQSEEISDRLIIERYPSNPWLPYPLTSAPKLSAAKWINDRINHYHPDLILSTDVDRFFLLGCWQSPGSRYADIHSIPYAAEFHTDLYNFSAAYPGWRWVPQFVKWSKLAKCLYRPVDITICPSHAAAETCHQIGIDRTQVISFCGVDVEQYSPKWRDRSFLNQWLSADEADHSVILFLGRLGLEKRVDLLIDAYAQLKRTQPKLSLILAGDAPADAVNFLKKRADQLPHIHFTGFLTGETKSKLYASCDVFCSPSPYETFGLTIIEAMASGIPVITVNTGAVSETVKQGVNGYLVPPDDVGAIARCLQSTLSSDNQNITQSAVEFAQRFSLDQGCQKLETYYRNLIEQSQPYSVRRSHTLSTS
jgi:phosphatidylinositol alpha 1,6-mannosyltransferase